MSERGLALHKAGNECQRRRTHLADCITLFQKLTKVLKEEAQTFHTITVIILTLLLVCFGRGKVNFFVSYEGSAPTGGEYFFTHNVLETMEKHRQSCLSKLQPKELEIVQQNRVLSPGQFTKKRGGSKRLPVAQKRLIKQYTIQGEINRAFFRRADKMRDELKLAKSDTGTLGFSKYLVFTPGGGVRRANVHERGHPLNWSNSGSSWCLQKVVQRSHESYKRSEKEQ